MEQNNYLIGGKEEIYEKIQCIYFVYSKVKKSSGLQVNVYKKLMFLYCIREFSLCTA